MNLNNARKELQKFLYNSKIKYRKLAKSGRLETSRLAFSNLSGLVYSIPIEGTGKNFSIKILIDFSGSMDGYKITRATESALNIKKLFEGLVDIQFVGFGTVFRKATEQDLRNNSLYRKFLSSFTPVIEINGKKIITNSLLTKSQIDDIYTGAKYIETCFTWSPSVLKQSLEDLKNVDGEKMVIIITDGNDEIGTGHYDANEIGGIPTKDYSKRSYGKIVKEYDDAGVGLLAIGIGQDVRHYKGREIYDPADIYGVIIDYLNDKYLGKK